MSRPSLREKSSWTPKNHFPSNEKIFKERVTLIKKWFSAWDEGQQWTLAEYVLKHLGDMQLTEIYKLLHTVIPAPDQDFTRVLPKNVCIKIFSYLDPQSLCRAAQVCWYWKYLSEDNEIWQPKCLKIGWFLPTPPSPFDNTAWKRHYVACVSQLHWNPPQPPDPILTADMAGGGCEDNHIQDRTDLIEVGKKTKTVWRHRPAQHPRGPWVPPDYYPKDIHLKQSAFTPASMSRFTWSPVKSKLSKVQPHSKCEQSQEYPHTQPPQVPMSLMHPTLLEKLRLGTPTTGYLCKGGSIFTNDLHEMSPFPNLPAYNVHCSRLGSSQEHNENVGGPRQNTGDETMHRKYSGAPSIQGQ